MNVSIVAAITMQKIEDMLKISLWNRWPRSKKRTLKCLIAFTTRIHDIIIYMNENSLLTMWTDMSQWVKTLISMYLNCSICSTDNCPGTNGIVDSLFFFYNTFLFDWSVSISISEFKSSIYFCIFIIYSLES